VEEERKEEQPERDEMEDLDVSEQQAENVKGGRENMREGFRKK
jgi:hypothetical protein